MSLSKQSDKKLRNSSETVPGGGTGAGHSIIESRTLKINLGGKTTNARQNGELKGLNSCQTLLFIN